jgi:regulator of protease activity HflC (stomatin/prohibitin superfamily)
MVTEKERAALPGGMVLLALLAGGVVDIWFIRSSAMAREPVGVLAGMVIGVALVIALGGLFVINPNEAKVLLLFGKYVGSVKSGGLRWTNPFYSKRSISLRAMSFETERLKVNDLEGNPIEIATIVIYRVVETAKAAFAVDDVFQFVKVQSEAALRNMATSYPYDSHDDAHQSLRGHTGSIAAHLKAEIQEKVGLAGVEIVDARISHLAYAPEIAQAMLQRQQASAIIAARQKIVEGAVGMVQMALEKLSREKVVQLDEERKAQMVANLLVVLCGERGTQPVVNAGTIY